MPDSAARRLRLPNGQDLISLGWPSRNLVGCLTLQLGSYCCPIVGIPFTAILPHAVLLPHLGPDCPMNVVQNYLLYPVWTIGPRLCLPGNKVLSVSDYVSALENTRWVWVLADILPGQA